MTEDEKPAGGLGPVARRLAATERVLCVEDEPDIAAFLRAYFRAAGYDFVSIDPESTQEIHDALAEHRPDVVLLDVRLRGGLSGIDFYREMRGDPTWAFTPVIVVSASAQTDPAFEEPGGIDGFVGKPFHTNTLAEFVKGRIERARELEAAGRHDVLELFTHDYLQARLADEIALAGSDGHFSFGLVRLRSMADIVQEVGEDGLDHLTNSLVASARSMLPDGAVFGLTTKEDELAVLLPDMSSRDAYGPLRRAMKSVAGNFTFAGGAVVTVDIVGGLASYPSHADDPEGLFMAADAALAAADDEGDLLQLAL